MWRVIAFFLWAQLSFAAPGAVCVPGFDSFQRNFYPHIRQRCASCHDEGSDGPPHSHWDPRVSYQNMEKLVNFSDQVHSKLMRYVRMQHWIDTNPLAQGATVDEVSQWLGEWWNGGENQCHSLAVIFENEIKENLRILSEESEGEE